MKTKILREIVPRCPKNNNLLMGQHNCMNCGFRGRSWLVELKDRPYTYTIECEYNKKKVHEVLENE